MDSKRRGEEGERAADELSARGDAGATAVDCCARFVGARADPSGVAAIRVLLHRRSMLLIVLSDASVCAAVSAVRDAALLAWILAAEAEVAAAAAWLHARASLSIGVGWRRGAAG